MNQFGGEDRRWGWQIVLKFSLDNLKAELVRL
jgi:hypothetical protein